MDLKCEQQKYIEKIQSSIPSKQLGKYSYQLNNISNYAPSIQDATAQRRYVKMFLVNFVKIIFD